MHVATLAHVVSFGLLYLKQRSHNTEVPLIKISTYVLYPRMTCGITIRIQTPSHPRFTDEAHRRVSFVLQYFSKEDERMSYS